MKIIVIASLLASVAVAMPMKSFKTRFTDFCSKHLTADDPYQYENVPSDQLEDFVTWLNDRVAWIELRARLDDDSVTVEEKINIRSFFNSLREKSE